MSAPRLRLSVLLAALVALLFVYPLFAGVGGGLGLFLSVVVLGVVRAVPAENGREQAGALVLAAAHLGPVWAWDSGAPAWALHAGLGAGVAFYGYAAVAVLRHLAAARRVTAEALYGAASVYLLLGVAWAVAFALLDALAPRSFTFPSPGGAVGASGFADYLYASLVTLTTLGYGDVLPTTRAARALVTAEAVAGVFYTTVVLARLVSVFAARAAVDEGRAGRGRAGRGRHPEPAPPDGGARVLD